MQSCRSEGTTLYRMNKSRDLMYSMVTTVNNIVLYTGNLLRVDVRYLGAHTHTNGK